VKIWRSSDPRVEEKELDEKIDKLLYELFGRGAFNCARLYPGFWENEHSRVGGKWKVGRSRSLLFRDEADAVSFHQKAVEIPGIGEVEEIEKLLDD
jgi:hypothetical protein